MATAQRIESFVRSNYAWLRDCLKAIGADQNALRSVHLAFVFPYLGMDRKIPTGSIATVVGLDRGKNHGAGAFDFWGGKVDLHGAVDPARSDTLTAVLITAFLEAYEEMGLLFNDGLDLSGCVVDVRVCGKYANSLLLVLYVTDISRMDINTIITQKRAIVPRLPYCYTEMKWAEFVTEPLAATMTNLSSYVHDQLGYVLGVGAQSHGSGRRLVPLCEIGTMGFVGVIDKRMVMRVFLEISMEVKALG